MPTKYREWDLGLRNVERKLVPGRVLLLRKQLVLLTLGAAVKIDGRVMRISGVVLLTPVDTGRARSSWNVSRVVPDTSFPPPGRGSYQATTAQDAKGKMVGLGTHETVWISSSLPYIEILEFGGYPDPPKRGSWVRGRYVIKSSGGRSRQAPQGMVRLTVENLEEVLRRTV